MVSLTNGIINDSRLDGKSNNAQPKLIELLKARSPQVFTEGKVEDPMKAERKARKGLNLYFPLPCLHRGFY